MNLYAISIDTSVPCESCRAHVQANALSFRLACPACGQSTPAHQKNWREQLAHVLRAYEDWPRGHKAPTVSVSGPLGPVTVGYDSPLACQHCQTPLTVDDPERALVGHALQCAKCGTETFFRRPPDGVAELGVEFLVGEDPTAAEGTPRKLLVATEPMVMHCPNCGAMVPLEGGARNKHCGYCAADVVIPDSIWRRLHPNAGAPPWYLAFTPERHHQLFYRPGSKRPVRDAGDPKTPPAALAYLSRDADEQVQKLVAANPAAPDDAFEVLSQSHFPNVVQALVDRYQKHGGTAALRAIVETIKSNRELKRTEREQREAALRAEEEARHAREAEQARAERLTKEAADERARQLEAQQLAEQAAVERQRAQQVALALEQQRASAQRRVFVGVMVGLTVLVALAAVVGLVFR